MPVDSRRLRVRAECERYVRLAALNGLGQKRGFGQNLGLAKDVEADVGRADRVRLAVNCVARLTVIISLIAISGILDHEQLLQLLLVL